MQSKTYDRLKWVSLVLLPGLASLYIGLSQFWPVPYVVQIVGTITVLDTFLGFLLRQSSKNYEKMTDSPKVFGDLVVMQDPDGVPTGRFRLEANVDNPIFEEGKLAGFVVKRAMEQR